MENVNNLIYICDMSNERDARFVLENAQEILEEYGNIKAADMCDLCGLDSCYADNFYGWAGDDIIGKAVIMYDNDKTYKVYMPQYNWHRELSSNKYARYERNSCSNDNCDGWCDECSSCDGNDNHEHEHNRESINITLSFDKYINHPEILAAIFKSLPENYGRMVFINIC